MSGIIASIKTKFDVGVENVREKFKDKPHNALMVIGVACAALALIPPLRAVGTLGSRLAVTAALTSNTPTGNKIINHLLTMSKVAAVAIAVAGLIIASPLVVSISLMANFAFNALEMVKAVRAKNHQKALMHLGLMAIDVLAIAGLLSGSWQVGLAAMAANFVFISAVALYAATRKEGAGRLLRTSITEEL